jgi:prolipoprotein diacylglyceryltransferase
MNPVCLQFGGLTFHWYGVLMAAGMLTGLLSWQWVARNRPWPPAFYSDLLFWIVLSGITGARIAYIASHWDDFAGRPLDMLRVQQGGLVFYGGFLASALAVWLFSRFHREPLEPVIDLVATSVPLAHAFGRIGCLMHGCCHGALTTSPFGVSYPPNSMAWVGQVDAGLITEQAAAGHLEARADASRFEGDFRILGKRTQYVIKLPRTNRDRSLCTSSSLENSLRRNLDLKIRGNKVNTVAMSLDEHV